jgi:hypothetical protein
MVIAIFFEAFCAGKQSTPSQWKANTRARRCAHSLPSVPITTLQLKHGGTFISKRFARSSCAAALSCSVWPWPWPAWALL